MRGRDSRDSRLNSRQRAHNNGLIMMALGGWISEAQDLLDLRVGLHDYI